MADERMYENKRLRKANEFKTDQESLKLNQEVDA
jgi:hypothetical protein